MSTYEFGAPLLTRTSEISDKVGKATVYFPLVVMGKNQRLKQIRVRIGFPVYRLENGRTRTFQKEYLATHADAPADLFTMDTDSLEAQRAQHEILKKLAEDEDLLKEFQSGTEQTEPIIITTTGVVVNGNRRLCTWRTLYYKEPEKYKYFEFIDVAVLPEDCDEAEIKALEKRLQIQKTHRAEYKWHNKAAMLKEEKAQGESETSIAKSYDISKKEVGLLIDAYEYAEIYLQKIGKPNQWSLVDGDEFAFKSMAEARGKISDQGKKELFEAVCFKLIEQKDYQGGRLYQVIPDIADNLEAIATQLQEKGLLPKTEVPVEPTDTPESDPDETSGDDVDLLGGEETQNDQYSQMASAIQDADVKLGGLAKQVIDEQKAQKAEMKSNRYLVNTLARVAKDLWNVETSGLNESTVTAGVQTHIDAIRERLSTIEEWVNSHQQSE